jgi:hypothetical protein
MLKIKKINKKLLIIFVSLFFYQCKEINYPLLEPEKFLTILEKEISLNYYFGDNIPKEEYLRTVKLLEPNIENLSILNAKDYFIEILRQNYKKDINTAENFYRKSIYELLKNFKGRNLYIVPSTVTLLNNKENNAGLGIVLYEEGLGKFFILDIIEGSSAYLAEIKPGQYLQAINNQSVSEFFLEDMVARLKGKAKTKVNVTIQGNNYDLYRSNYQVLPVRKTKWIVKNKQVLYLQIRFTFDGVAEQIKQYLFETQNPDYLVIDIRYLSYGDIEEILKIVDLFIPQKPLFKIYIKNQKEETYSSTENIYFTGKIIVLHQSKSTPFAFAFARLMEQAYESVILGPMDQMDIFIGKEIPIKEGNQMYGAFYLTNGYMEFIHSLNPKKWIQMENFISTYPPAEKPNLEDPYHRRIVEIISRD